MKVFNLGTWNVRTLLDNTKADRPERRTTLITKELARYNVDIAALSKTCLADKGQLTEHGGGYTFFWSGRSSTEHCEAGVGFDIRSHLAWKLAKLPEGINDRLMSVQLPLGNKKNVTLISAYGPTMTNPEDIKDKFHEELDALIAAVPQSDKLFVLGDFNARSGTVSKCKLHTQPLRRLQGQKPARRLNIPKLNHSSTAEEFVRGLAARPPDAPQDEQDSIEEQWATFRDAIYSTAFEHLGPAKCKHQDWFNENDEEIQALLSENTSCSEHIRATPPHNERKTPLATQSTRHRRNFGRCRTRGTARRPTRCRAMQTVTTPNVSTTP